MSEKEVTPETLDTYEDLMKALADNDKQEQLLYWLYQELGKRVAEKVQEAYDEEGETKTYDVVSVSLKEVLEEFELSNVYFEMKSIFTDKHDLLVRFLKLGYGTPEEIFRDYA
jgi:hypothetical protein